MQGMVMGMNHVTTGLGALLGSALYNIVAVVTAAAGKIHNAIKLTFYTFLIFINHFSGPGRAVGPVCVCARVCVCVFVFLCGWMLTYEVKDS